MSMQFLLFFNSHINFKTMKGILFFAFVLKHFSTWFHMYYVLSFGNAGTFHFILFNIH